MATKPVFFVQHPVHGGDHIGQAIEIMGSLFGDRIAIGLLTDLPSHDPRSIGRFFSEGADLAEVFVADPATHGFNPDMKGYKRAAKRFPYVRATVPQNGDRAWLEDVITVQKESGANLLLTPTTLLSAADGEDGLTRQLDWADEAMSLADGYPMAANLTVDAEWLSHRNLRTTLLNALVETSWSTFFLRVRWPVLEPVYGQQDDQALIRGYQEVCEWFSSESRALFLPNTGLTGWLCLGFGASGFSTGLSRSHQAYAVLPTIRRQKGKPAPPPRERYFERQLLHTVELDAHDELWSRRGYERCTCPYCGALGAFKKPRSGWDHDLAAMHYLFSVASITAEVATQPVLGVTKMVEKAGAYERGLQSTRILRGDDSPRHLEVWRQVLQNH